MLHFCENGSNMFLAHVIPIFRSSLTCFPKILGALENSSLIRDGVGLPGRSTMVTGKKEMVFQMPTGTMVEMTVSSSKTSGEFDTVRELSVLKLNDL